MRNFETIFLSGIGRPKHKSIIEVLYTWENRYEEEVDGRNTVKVRKNPKLKKKISKQMKNSHLNLTQ